ncbi:MAG: hypothetical protein RQ751_11620 [Longimicrobiales bacterium]|nr:hypothetical protein [Longimicrobiales bacterium]
MKRAGPHRAPASGVAAFLLAVGAGFLHLCPAPLSAQSVASGYGFGAPLEALGSRALALGGIGMGLTGTELNPQDPAAAADVVLPAIFVTSQTSWADVTEAGQASDFTTTRFPSLGLIYPFAGVGTFMLSFTGVLDQTWRTSEERLLTLEGSGTQARVTDFFQSEGGVSALQVGYARRISPRLAVGVTAGSYIGTLTRTFRRSFDSLEVETDVPDFVVGGTWNYEGFFGTVGATWEVSDIARLSGSFSLGGELEGDPTESTDGARLLVQMPNEYRVGGTVLLAEGLNLSAGVLYADWADAGGDVPGVEGTTVLKLGGGVEFTGARILGKGAALRFGYRNGDLPFRRAGDPEVSESAFTGGLGLNLLEGQDVLLARSDFTLERGSRDAGVFEEDFWRLSVTIRVSGF